MPSKCFVFVAVYLCATSILAKELAVGNPHDFNSQEDVPQETVNEPEIPPGQSNDDAGDVGGHSAHGDHGDGSHKNSNTEYDENGDGDGCDDENSIKDNYTFIALIDIMFTDGCKRTCTGCIIHDNVVITAAHCFTMIRNKFLQPELSLSFVVIGTKRMFETGYEQYLPIERVVTHPRFSGWTADLALVFTFANMNTDKPGKILPLALEKSSVPVDSNVTVLSWGKCKNDLNEESDAYQYEPYIHGTGQAKKTVKGKAKKKDSSESEEHHRYHYQRPAGKNTDNDEEGVTTFRHRDALRERALPTTVFPKDNNQGIYKSREKVIPATQNYYQSDNEQETKEPPKITINKHAAYLRLGENKQEISNQFDQRIKIQTPKALSDMKQSDKELHHKEQAWERMTIPPEDTSANNETSYGSSMYIVGGKRKKTMLQHNNENYQIPQELQRQLQTMMDMSYRPKNRVHSTQQQKQHHIPQQQQYDLQKPEYRLEKQYLPELSRQPQPQQQEPQPQQQQRQLQQELQEQHQPQHRLHKAQRLPQHLQQQTSPSQIQQINNNLQQQRKNDYSGNSGSMSSLSIEVKPFQEGGEDVGVKEPKWTKAPNAGLRVKKIKRSQVRQIRPNFRISSDTRRDHSLIDQKVQSFFDLEDYDGQSFVSFSNNKTGPEIGDETFIEMIKEGIKDTKKVTQTIKRQSSNGDGNKEYLESKIIEQKIVFNQTTTKVNVSKNVEPLYNRRNFERQANNSKQKHQVPTNNEGNLDKTAFRYLYTSNSRLFENNTGKSKVRRQMPRFHQMRHQVQHFDNWRRQIGVQHNNLTVGIFGYVNIASCKKIIERTLPPLYEIKNKLEHLCYASEEFYITNEDSGAPVVQNNELVAVTVGGVDSEGEHVAVGIKVACFCNWIANHLPNHDGDKLKCCRDCCNEKRRDDRHGSLHARASKPVIKNANIRMRAPSIFNNQKPIKDFDEDVMMSYRSNAYSDYGAPPQTVSFD